MNAVAPRKNLAKSLECIAEFVFADPDRAPVDFVRELARSWKERGGLLAGKLRHSDRYLDELLRMNDTPIRSLTPKLGGRTNLRPSDAGILVRIFLSHWKYKGDPSSGEITVPTSNLYEPMFSETEIRDVSAYIAGRITAVAYQMASPEGEKAPAIAAPLGQDTIDLIVNEFKESIALFIAAIGSPLLVPRPEEALLGFRKLMDRLRSIERDDARARMLIWTMDLGRQVFDDPESRRRFMHVRDLTTRLKALEFFKDDETWNWLKKRAVVVLHDIRSGRPDGSRLPAFDPHHVLFSAIPPIWAGSRQFIDLYGRRPAQANYTVFLRPLEQLPSRARRQDQIASQSCTLRYFGHALIKPDENSMPQMRGLQLDAPGRSYDEALGTVFFAAHQMLNLPDMFPELVIDGTRIVPAHASQKLAHHGFRLLRLDDFVGF